MRPARERGRISSTELGSLVGAAPSNVHTVLRTLEAEGILEPSRPNRRGAGSFYRPTAVSNAVSE
ncbi:winged helix-turn-helix domain-containing protein [Isoptericola halotolerans]|uniref:winged helix-turn-helix domain-containing protein n=1 Tax=Isoptericola halotolerans TaxID=300560 RepID=UPI00388FFE9E